MSFSWINAEPHKQAWMKENKGQITPSPPSETLHIPLDVGEPLLVALSLADSLAVGDAEPVALGDGDGVDVCDGDGEGDALLLSEVVGDAVGDAVCDDVGVGVGDSLAADDTHTQIIHDSPHPVAHERLGEGVRRDKFM